MPSGDQSGRVSPEALGGDACSIAALSLFVERRSRPDAAQREVPVAAHFVSGPWPLSAGAVGLALVNVATLLIAGRPWGVVSAFALWGSKLLAAAGADVAHWAYWFASPARLADLNGRLSSDVTTVMDVGIMLGALGAAALAGRFAPQWKIGLRSFAAAMLGGLLLGVRGAHRLRLQHRRALQRDRLGQLTRLALVRGGAAGQCGGDSPTAALRAVTASGFAGRALRDRSAGQAAARDLDRQYGWTRGHANVGCSTDCVKQRVAQSHSGKRVQP